MAEREKWLITGGAGYIGSHVADEFLRDGKQIAVYDNLETGIVSRLKYLEDKHKREVPFILGDIRDADTLLKSMIEERITGIVHTAALKSVSESFLDPRRYVEVNAEGTASLIEAAENSAVQSFIFSSSAAVYSSPSADHPISEESLTVPNSPYGASKLLAEKYVGDFLSHSENFGTSLRFFNVAGCSTSELMDKSKDNLIPITLQRILSKEAPEIFGDEYNTPDGTCIRDFVDVRDIARAHLLVANVKKRLPAVMNVGTGKGTSVREVINILAKVFRVENVNPRIEKSRKGDPPSVFADVALIRKEIGFVPEYSILQSIESLRD